MSDKHFKEMPVSAAAMPGRVIRFIGSDETADRGGDIVSIDGWKVDNYLKNPVVLWAHNSTMPPIGKAVRVEVDKRSKQLKFDVQFPTVEEIGDSEHSRFIETIYNMYKGGYLSAVSVGFSGTGKPIESKDKWMTGVKFDNQELFELSLVPVPANPNALVSAKSAGLDIELYTKGAKMEHKEAEAPEVKAGARLSKTSRERLEKLASELRAFLDEDQEDACGPKDEKGSGIEEGGEGGIEKPADKAIDDLIDLGKFSLDEIKKSLR